MATSHSDFSTTTTRGMQRAALFALIAGVSAAVAHLTDDWADWECPGFPCYIVNYFEYQPHGKLSQTCGGSDLPMEDCNNLSDGTSWDAVWSNGTVAGSHKLTKPHPCMVHYMGGCVQTSCIQSTEAKCHAACDALNMLPYYAESCHDHCSYGECKGL